MSPIADAVSVLHASYVLVLIAAPALFVAGRIEETSWLRAWPLRALHLGAVAFAGVQYASGWRCPLTVLERTLREQPTDADFLAMPGWLARDGALAPAGWAVVAVYLMLTAFAHLPVRR